MTRHSRPRTGNHRPRPRGPGGAQRGDSLTIRYASTSASTRLDLLDGGWPIAQVVLGPTPVVATHRTGVPAAVDPLTPQLAATLFAAGLSATDVVALEQRVGAKAGMRAVALDHEMRVAAVDRMRTAWRTTRVAQRARVAVCPSRPARRATTRARRTRARRSAASRAGPAVPSSDGPCKRRRGLGARDGDEGSILHRGAA